MADAAKKPAPVDFDAGGTWDAQTIELDYPFKLDGVTYERVVLRMPMGLDIERYLTEPNRTTATFMKSLAETPDAAWARMHPADYRKCFGAASRFLS